jgi:5-methyltetrahydrofolate--homocysteine methyltransferase
MPSINPSYVHSLLYFNLVSVLGKRLSSELIRRILVLDGAMGTMLQGAFLQESDFRGKEFAESRKSLEGNNDILSLTRPDIVYDIHK